MWARSVMVIIALLATVAATAVSGQIRSDIVYGHKDGMALVYDVFHADQPNGAGVVFMVSGGWFSIWQPAEQRAAMFERLLGEGFTVFAVHHGSAPRFKVPEAVSDVRAAVRHIKANAGQFGIDPERLGVWGGSAGGHLSLMLGLDAAGKPDGASGGRRSLGPHYLTSDGDARLAAVVAYYPPVDLTTRVGPSERFPALDFPAEQAEAISPIRFVSADDPPTLLIHGDSDDLVPLRDSEIIAAELEKTGVTHELVVIEGGDHGFRNPADRAAAGAAMVAWFKTHLAP